MYNAPKVGGNPSISAYSSVSEDENWISEPGWRGRGAATQQTAPIMPPYPIVYIISDGVAFWAGDTNYSLGNGTYSGASNHVPNGHRSQSPAFVPAKRKQLDRKRERAQNASLEASTSVTSSERVAKRSASKAVPSQIKEASKQLSFKSTLRAKVPLSRPNNAWSGGMKTHEREDTHAARVKRKSGEEAKSRRSMWPHKGRESKLSTSAAKQIPLSSSSRSTKVAPKQSKRTQVLSVPKKSSSTRSDEANSKSKARPAVTSNTFKSLGKKGSPARVATQKSIIAPTQSKNSNNAVEIAKKRASSLQILKTKSGTNEEYQKLASTTNATITKPVNTKLDSKAQTTTNRVSASKVTASEATSRQTRASKATSKSVTTNAPPTDSKPSSSAVKLSNTKGQPRISSIPTIEPNGKVPSSSRDKETLNNCPHSKNTEGKKKSMLMPRCATPGKSAVSAPASATSRDSKLNAGQSMHSKKKSRTGMSASSSSESRSSGNSSQIRRKSKYKGGGKHKDIHTNAAKKIRKGKGPGRKTHVTGKKSLISWNWDLSFIDRWVHDLQNFLGLGGRSQNLMQSILIVTAILLTGILIYLHQPAQMSENDSMVEALKSHTNKLSMEHDKLNEQLRLHSRENHYLREWMRQMHSELMYTSSDYRDAHTATNLHLLPPGANNPQAAHMHTVRQAYTVAIPMGVKGGQEFEVDVNNVIYILRCPDEGTPGQTIAFDVPKPNAFTDIKDDTPRKILLASKSGQEIVTTPDGQVFLSLQTQ
mmetsp:Transcript_6729/g.10300  ORF Transcript_6729/g.10300 Transcript_6729/m.10300 type:complete len:763 (+) Transcript_6729:95-2383(+)